MGINSSSIVYGVKDVRISKSEDFLNDYGPVLTSANSVGFKGQTSVIKKSEPIKRIVCRNGRVFSTTIGYKSESIEVSTVIKEFTPSNLGMLLGRGNDITTDQSLLSKDFPLALTEISNFRIEVVCGYVNRTNHFTFIIPSAEIISELDFAFSDGEYLTQGINFASIPLNNTTWNLTPIGRMFTS